MEYVRTRAWFALAIAGTLTLAGSLGWAQSAGGEGDGSSESEESGIDARAELNRANSLAGQGRLTQSIRHYEKVLKHAAERHPSAHYNLAEVLKAKEDFDRALIHYQAYLLMGNKSGTKSKSERGIETLKARVWNKKLAKLSVDIEPEKQATIAIDGMPVARNQDLEEFELVAGDYEVSAEIVDHEPISKTVELEHEEEESIELQPTKKTFFGKVKVDVDQDEAEVELKPEDLDAPREPNEGAKTTSPVESPIELETGKWLLEVEKEGFHRWVRYVDVKRDQTTTVDVNMEKKLPEEIR